MHKYSDTTPSNHSPISSKPQMQPEMFNGSKFGIVFLKCQPIPHSRQCQLLLALLIYLIDPTILWYVPRPRSERSEQNPRRVKTVNLMPKQSVLKQYWRNLNINSKLKLAFSALLILVVLMGLAGLTTLILTRYRVETTFFTLQTGQLLPNTPQFEQLLASFTQSNRQVTIALGVVFAIIALLATLIVLLLNRTILRNVSQLARAAVQLQQEKKRSDDLLNVVIPIGVALSAEQNFDRLLEKILLEAKAFCNADAGTLYLRSDNNELKFVIVRNDSLNIAMGGTSGQPINFPPVPIYHPDTGQPNHSNVAAHVALTGEAINIPNAYHAAGFNFSGTKAFDNNTGYHSTSFLTIPLKNAHNHVVGVLQLINAQDARTGQIIPFDRGLEQIVESLSSLATVALEAYIRERKLRQQIQQLRIEIDEVKRQRQVSEIIETDFFQDLQIKAREIRRRSKSGRFERSD